MRSFLLLVTSTSSLRLWLNMIPRCLVDFSLDSFVPPSSTTGSCAFLGMVKMDAHGLCCFKLDCLHLAEQLGCWKHFLKSSHTGRQQGDVITLNYCKKPKLICASFNTARLKHPNAGAVPIPPQNNVGITWTIDWWSNQQMEPVQTNGDWISWSDPQPEEPSPSRLVRSEWCWDL